MTMREAEIHPALRESLKDGYEEMYGTRNLKEAKRRAYVHEEWYRHNKQDC